MGKEENANNSGVDKRREKMSKERQQPSGFAETKIPLLLAEGEGSTTKKWSKKRILAAAVMRSTNRDNEW